PLFIFGAVAVGMFGLPWLGARLALAHYVGAFLVGIAFRFYGGSGQEGPRKEERREGGLLGRAVARLVAARREDGRPLGQLLGDAVTDSVRTLLMICGFIVLFSVFVRLLAVMRLDAVVAVPLGQVFRILGLSPELVPAAVAGLLEIDLGTVAASTAPAPLVQRALVASAIIAWSGLSVHGQVASVLTGTDIRMGPYAVARLLHAALAAIFTVPALQGAAALGRPTVPVFSPLSPGGGFWQHLFHAATWALAMPAGVLAVGVAVAALTGGLRWAGFYHRRP
ncbi:MAG: sporulation integral membrane protein YlbJ, partial [Firmicutes bacterium]|nr:sporulation integral membrane protein YlbJ [Bacillota bacterium]